MKISVNYDLLDKIKESNTGLSLIKTRGEIFKFTVMFLPLDILFNLGDYRSIVLAILFRLSMNSAFIPIVNKYLFPGFNQSRAEMQLKNLVKILREYNVNTDYELLQSAYQYDKKYNVFLDENKNPRLKQEKYIMVPVVDRDGEKEVSLLQEHIVGTKEYELSYGSPKKVLKLAYNSI